MENSKIKKKMELGWVLYAFLSMFGVAFIHLGFKFVGNRLNPSVLLLYTIMIQGTIYAVFIYKNKFSLKLSLPLLFILISMAVVASAANVFQVKSINLAPNPGYVSAIGSSAIILVTMASIFLFSSELTLLKTLGILLTVIGVILVGFGK